MVSPAPPACLLGMSTRIETPGNDRTISDARMGEWPDVMLRSAVALVAAMLTMIAPWVGVVVLALLALVYAAAAGLFLATALVAGSPQDYTRAVCDGMSDLARGRIGRIWPAAAALTFLVLLTV